MAMSFSKESEAAIVKAISEALNDAIMAEIEPLAKAAHDQLDKAIREKVAEFAMRTLSYYEVHRDRQNIVITVKVPEVKP